MVAPPSITLENVHWARDGPKFSCRFNGCDTSYMAKYNLIRHLQACHNVVMEMGKPKRPSIQEKGPRHQDHMAMNVWVLSNLLVWFHHNEQKTIVKPRRHANLEWDRL
jgi:hypothetical protein